MFVPFLPHAIHIHVCLHTGTLACSASASIRDGGMGSGASGSAADAMARGGAISTSGAEAAQGQVREVWPC